MELLRLWAPAFLFTWLVELCVVSPLLGRKNPLARRAAAITFAQILTHPAVWFIWPLLNLSRARFLIAAESWAVVGELLFYKFAFPALSVTRCTTISALANLASFTLGRLLF